MLFSLASYNPVDVLSSAQGFGLLGCTISMGSELPRAIRWHQIEEPHALEFITVGLTIGLYLAAERSFEDCLDMHKCTA